MLPQARHDAISERAFLVMNSLQGETAEATEEIDLGLLETDDAFRPLFKVLDEYYKCDNQTQLPARTGQIFGRFARQDKESMKLCCVRHQRDLRKLKEVGMEIPDMLAGWRLLTRAAILPSGAAQVRSQCVDGLSWQKVGKALLDACGAEGLPDKRDIKRVERVLLAQNARGEDNCANDYEWGRGLSYEDTCLEEGEYEDEAEHEYEDADEEAEIAEELPQDVEGAQLACDEAYLSFVDAKKRVAEIAKSRSFCPIVAVAPDNNYQREAAPSAGSTGTGSTQQHGPRFKRFRHGGFARAETESGNMVEDIETLEYANSTEEVFLLTVGKGISDGGATRPVMGDKVWAQWEELLRVKQLLCEVKYDMSDRRFRFGDGKTLGAKKAVTLTVWPFGVKKQVAIHLVEGWAPLPIARPCMEEWGLVQGWMKSERDGKGHFIIDLLGSAGKEADDAMNEGAATDGETPTPNAYYLEIVTEFYDIGSDGEALATERFAEAGLADMDADTYSGLTLALEQAETDMEDTLRGPRKRVVWEVFVDKGALSEELLEFPQVKVVQFRQADGWDFSKPSVIRYFLNKIDEEKPDDIFFAPPCRIWCSWQYVNEKLSEERAKEINLTRQREERAFLKMVRGSFAKQQNGGRHATAEGPWQGLHWQTKTWQTLPGYHCRLDQCRLGAKFEIKEKLMPYQKPTRLQSANKEFIHHVSMLCRCADEHVVLRGKLAQQVQNYPRPMARRMAYLIANQGMADDAEDINAAEQVYKDIDAIEYTDVMQELMKRFSVSTVRAVKRAHISLGHPSNAALAAAMMHAKAPAKWIQCAKLFQCEVCRSRQRPRAVRVAVLPKAKRFNKVVNTDVYYVTWKNKERKILAPMGEFTRYEVDYPIAKGTFKKEVKLFQKLWISWTRKPDAMRVDMAGPHTSRNMHQWMSKHNSALDQVPTGAHHKLGLMGRNHAVRGEQLSKCRLQFPDDSLKTALRMTASQRDILRNVHGCPPATLVLGTQPKVPGALCDEDFGLAEQAALVDPKSEVHEMMVRRAAAGTAFIENNCSRAVRAALLARSRPTRRECQIGEWVYFWRPEMSTGLEKCHWHGPALVVAVESKVNGDDVMHASVVWVTHGCTIYRCTVEQLRPELTSETREREGRREDPDSPFSTIEKLRRALRRARWACSFSDLAEGGQRPQCDDALHNAGAQQPGAQGHRDGDRAEQEREEPSGAAAAAAPEAPQPAEAGEEAAPGPAPSWASAARERGNATREPSRVHIEAMAKRSIEEAEKLDGIPLSKRARMSWARLAPQQGESCLIEEVGDEMMLLEESTETIYMLAFKRKVPAIVEGELTSEEREQFYAAKLEALEVFNKNDGWGPIDEAEVGPAACCPLRFLLKWKVNGGQRVANARVLYQGFKHRYDAEGQLDKEEVEAVRCGCEVRVSARGIKLHASPAKEMREMLVHQIGLQPGQLLKMVKPCFGGPRSPKLWHYRSDEVTKEIGFKNHWLEDCLLLSLRAARPSDDPFDVRSFDGQTFVVDGLIGMHVGDFIGCGENVSCEDDLCAKLGDAGCFQARLGTLNEKLKFGKWEFGPSLVFTGGEVEQSLSTYAVSVKFEKYLRAVKPITVEKHRRADPTSALSPKERASFRTLNGQLNWPAAQGVIIAAATVSFRAAATGHATVQDLLGANKDLRFPKANADELNAGTPTPFVAMEWASKKLVRLCRSSLSSEAQAAAMGADSLMWVNVFLALSLRPDLGRDAAMTYLGESPFITDAKCL
ncbi:unnamed protein product [Prorocentrum cordatum]|uniref:RNA-directed RNA polymerase n=1 Tax=Prorocentrum cordatum TaxID=2364126 RepID=A0ABN9WC80_9DINO|nr:unnamed protein product [Polarella glacialis]